MTGAQATRTLSPADPTSFRALLGSYPTGVVLLTAQTETGPVGMSMNSFTSVSLDPPLIAVCAAYSSTTWPAIREAGAFAITILGSHHDELCRLFSRRGADRFGNREWESTEAGHPTLSDGVAWLDCSIVEAYSAGDHELVVAKVLSGDAPAPGAPLVFHTGKFSRLHT